MKVPSDIRNSLLHALESGEFLSGQQLAEDLGVSRSAISNHVKALQDLGLDIFSVSGKGYKLANKLTLLDSNIIQRNTQTNLFKGTSSEPVKAEVTNVNVQSVVDSTNQVIRNNISKLSQGAVCIAEAQTAGRGRRGKVWQSPFGANLYLSMFWRFDSGYQALDGLSLAVGVAVANAINNLYGLEVQLKWPNDIYYLGKKLGGILVEVDGQFGGACSTIIGVGLNVSMPANTDIDQPWSDLSQAVAAKVPTKIDRNQLACELINTLRSTLMTFEENGFESFVDTWRAIDVFANKPITLLNGNNRIVGVCRGIDTRGGLLLEQNGEINAFYGGEISVRAN